MKKYLYDESNGLQYRLRGDYYLPCLSYEPLKPMEIWAQRHLDYLIKSRKEVYTGLMISGNINEYLEGIYAQAEEMYTSLMDIMCKNESITEMLKAEDQMEWVRRMNCLQNRVNEIINVEIIYK